MRGEGDVEVCEEKGAVTGEGDVEVGGGGGGGGAGVQ